MTYTGKRKLLTLTVHKRRLVQNGKKKGTGYFRETRAEPVGPYPLSLRIQDGHEQDPGWCIGKADTEEGALLFINLMKPGPTGGKIRNRKEINKSRVPNLLRAKICKIRCITDKNGLIYITGCLRLFINVVFSVLSSLQSKAFHVIMR